MAVNLKQLSEHLKLSQTTVSRALNGYPEVNEETRKRVQAAAKAMNYSPNIRAKGLATGRAMAIGHVIPVSNKHEMVNPVFGDFIAGAGEAYSQAGYEMVLTLVADDNEERAYRKIKAKGNVDGLIVHGPRMIEPRIPLLTDLEIPFVVHGRASQADTGYAWVDINNKRAFQRATAYLADLGHRRIALINGLEDMDFAYRRRAGYTDAMAKAGLEVDPALLFSEEMTEIYGYRTAQDLLARDNPPTAFLVSSMITAIGVRRAIDAAGLKMGRDVSIITHDDDLSYLQNGDSVPIFTATRSSVREAGYLSAKMLLGMIDQKPETPPTRMLEAELIIGDSTGRAPS
ncbi:LacI family DNA-binding transcriptional regulator [Pseudoprimorskyibacter insulae]|uniref:Putative HTH-type transcriptional repressor ExuR n=1 Tax=Pseudoprimorskyibacter insulae TaxID=1695997 RepID=A0A2R8AXL4_9RHOB|nr:substrate-binding domain-containing protein [Pseudoprimorskyibacter insulae]SPF80782.1 putative HTH-type transcriptional repressor ExuR [Pseudoprimorskyibacter insulae]